MYNAYSYSEFKVTNQQRAETMDEVST